MMGWGDEIAINHIPLDQHLHHGEGQGGIGARFDHQVYIGPLGRPVAVGIDDHQGGSGLPGHAKMGPGMDVGGQGVAAPNNYVVCV